MLAGGREVERSSANRSREEFGESEKNDGHGKRVELFCEPPGTEAGCLILSFPISLPKQPKIPLLTS